ncbi:MAG: NapC/NirT family cytochrome c [Bacteriovoracaceae bacterium]|nr:NapC/NirT family cytochrome c [Bacteriovoracaceae bacterium]
MSIIFKERLLRIVGMLGLVLCGLLLAYFISITVSSTSDYKFCGRCHTMQAVVDSYRQDVHGGNNKMGFMAKCTSCHLPHTGTIRYLFVKARISAHDVMAEIFYDKSKIDWHKKRSHRESFTYDSGCMKCHSNLQAATMKNRKAFVAHRPIFDKTEKTACVTCHERVGHHNIEEFLNN